MGQVLTQQEIDALLSAISSGEIDAEEIKKEEENLRVRLYDFRRPNKLSKEHIKAIEMIHDNYARNISNYFSSQTRVNVQVRVASVEQVTYEEFVRSIPNPTLLSNFRLMPLNGSLLLEMNPQLGFQVIDLLCGGSGKNRPPAREFTDIERSILSELIGSAIDRMKLAWEDVCDVSPIMDTIETNPQLNQTMSPNEPVVLITFMTEILDEHSFINVCIPYLSLEKIIDKLYIQHWFVNEDTSVNEGYREFIEEKIVQSKVNMSILLGKSHITIEDFMGLSVGDVLQLDKKASLPLKMYVEDQMRFLVQPGSHKGKLAVQVVEIAEKDVDDDE